MYGFRGGSKCGLLIGLRAPGRRRDPECGKSQIFECGMRALLGFTWCAFPCGRLCFVYKLMRLLIVKSTFPVGKIQIQQCIAIGRQNPMGDYLGQLKCTISKLLARAIASIWYGHFAYQQRLTSCLVSMHLFSGVIFEWIHSQNCSAIFPNFAILQSWVVIEICHF